MLEIKSRLCTLREFSEEHIMSEKYIAWMRDLEVISNLYKLDYLTPLDIELIRNDARALVQSRENCFFAIHEQSSGQFIGTIKLGHINWRAGVADLGILIGEKKYWGKGLAQDAMVALCQYAFSALSLRRISGGTPACNKSMLRCFEKVGFKHEGSHRQSLLINGEYHDHVFYGLLKEEFTV